MHAASSHGTPRLTSLAKDDEVSCEAHLVQGEEGWSFLKRAPYLSFPQSETVSSLSLVFAYSFMTYWFVAS